NCGASLTNEPMGRSACSPPVAKGARTWRTRITTFQALAWEMTTASGLCCNRWSLRHEHPAQIVRAVVAIPASSLDAHSLFGRGRRFQQAQGQAPKRTKILCGIAQADPRTIFLEFDIEYP